jgi:hypothetical protein
MSEDKVQWQIVSTSNYRYVFDDRGRLHCENGHAVVYGDGIEGEYWLNGEKIGGKEEWERLVKLKAFW